MKNGKILIIDDEKDICFLLKGMLKTSDYEVHTANTLSEGTALFTEIQPRIVFLDINLPDGFGLSVISNFINLKSNVKVIVMSAYDSQLARALKNGAYTFLNKPFSKEAVLNLLDQIDGEKKNLKTTNIDDSEENVKAY